MKQSFVKISVLSIVSLLAVPSASAMETQTKQDLTALGTIAVATAAAGPVGFLVGAVGGKWLAGQVETAASHDAMALSLEDTNKQLAAANEALTTVQSQLDASRQEQRRFARMALEQLQLEMLFKTGESAVTDKGRERLALLATFLKRNKDLEVTVSGFADPRGDAAANLALSKARAEQVVTQLASVGVPRSRMRVLAHGESHSSALAGDLDAYALERVVSIELTQDDTQRSVAAVDLAE